MLTTTIAAQTWQCQQSSQHNLHPLQITAFSRHSRQTETRTPTKQCQTTGHPSQTTSRAAKRAASQAASQTNIQAAAPCPPPDHDPGPGCHTPQFSVSAKLSNPASIPQQPLEQPPKVESAAAATCPTAHCRHSPISIRRHRQLSAALGFQTTLITRATCAIFNSEC